MAKEIQKKAGVSGNSVAGKSFQIFTVSEELLAKVVEAVQVSGPADYVLKAVVPDIRAWSRISDAMLDKGVSIENVRTTVVMKTTKRFAGLPLPSATSGR